MEESAFHDAAADAVPQLDFGRVAELLSALAGEVGDSATRAQLSAAAGLIASAPAMAGAEPERRRLEADVAAALTEDDLETAVERGAELASFDRARVGEIDWSAASGA